MARTRQVFFRSSILRNILSNNCWLNSWFIASIWIILPNSWIAIWLPLIFTTKCYFLFRFSKFQNVFFILSRAWNSFLWSLVRRYIFFNECRLDSWFYWRWVIWANGRVIIGLPFVFTSEGYFIHILTNLFNVSIVLSWCWIIFFLFLTFLVVNYFGWRGRRLNKLNCRMNIICSNRWIWIRLPLIFSSNCHFLVWTMPKWLYMIIILTRVWHIIFFPFWRLFTDEKSFISLLFRMWQCLVNIVLARCRIRIRFEIVFVIWICEHLGGIQRSLKKLTVLNLFLAGTSVKALKFAG